MLLRCGARAAAARPAAAARRRLLVPMLTLRLAACLSGGRRGRRYRGPRLPPPALRRVAGGVPEIARCFPERYAELLGDKVRGLEALLGAAAAAPLPTTEVFESPPLGFRMRASFKIWREGAGDDAERHLVM